jgi:3-methyladenine DNA glycosylase AlkC
MAEQRLMKDGLGPEAVRRIASALENSGGGFSAEAFSKEALEGMEFLELKERVQHLIGVMRRYLPEDFEKTADILMAVKDHWDYGDPDDNLRGFAAWPIIDYIGEHGLDHPEKSLEAMKHLTSLFSAEFAIRPFIIQHYDVTFDALMDWTSDPDEHVRRLASEGSRPRLPWGQQLPQFIKDPAPLFTLLDNLKDDPSEYVRRSVANNLNDISKDHPEKVIALCKDWKWNAGQHREWIIRHATRSLVKAGHPEVFGLLGYTENPNLKLSLLKVAPKDLKMGESIEFSFTLQSASTKPQNVVIDYVIHHMKANGRTSRKVFKMRTLEIGPGETVELTKKHAVKPITTRTYYPGEHAVEILINGKTFGQAVFTLHIE